MRFVILCGALMVSDAILRAAGLDPKVVYSDGLNKGYGILLICMLMWDLWDFVTRKS